VFHSNPFQHKGVFNEIKLWKVEQGVCGYQMKHNKKPKKRRKSCAGFRDSCETPKCWLIGRRHRRGSSWLCSTADRGFNGTQYPLDLLFWILYNDGNKRLNYMPFTYKYARPALTVDCIVFGLDEGDLKVLLIQRALQPFAGRWALPGGFVRMDETLDDAARRELREETGLAHVFLEQLYTYGQLDRDPRERVVSVAYYALVRLNDHSVKAATDARITQWFQASKPPKLAFDHAIILEAALQRLKGKVRYQPIGFELLPPKFTLYQLHHLYEALLGVEMDKGNFRKKILSMGLLIGMNEYTQARHRPAQLFRFDQKKYEQLHKHGFIFEV
jgi:8-oxo-dGTP diphosphatase